MDAGRFGRAMGTGARAAAKAALEAAQAAAASGPEKRTPDTHAPRSTAAAFTADAPKAQVGVRSRVVLKPSSLPAAGAAAVSTPTRTGSLRIGGRQFGRAAWKPVARASSVLWLEVTGVLFGMFAAVAAVESWRGRAALTASDPASSGRSHEVAALVMLAGFGYLTFSNFVRARRRGQRP